MMGKYDKIKQEKAVTMVALVVTIIIIIILARNSTINAIRRKSDY